MWAEGRKLLCPFEWPKLREGRERRKVRKTELFVFLIPPAGGYPRTITWFLHSLGHSAWTACLLLYRR